MQERIFEYGTKVNVEVVSSNKNLVAVADFNEPREGYILLGHGLTILPNKGDKGYIVFERDNRRGHWQYYPSKNN